MGVPDEGKLSARIVLVGEVPSKWDVIKNRPFVGPNGNRLEVWWRRFGLRREDFYFTYLLDHIPDHPVSAEEWVEATHKLHARLRRLEDPWLIVPFSSAKSKGYDYPLYAVTGKGKVPWQRKDGKYERPGTLDWRGSILSTQLDDNRGLVKVIPTLHPQRVFAQPDLERKSLRDWQRIAEEAQTPAIETPQRTLHIKPTVQDVRTFVSHARFDGLPLAIDIETPRGRTIEYQTAEGWVSGLKKADEAKVLRYKSGKKKGQLKMRKRRGNAYIGCIGFSNNPEYALCIPLTLEYWKNAVDLVEVKALVARLLGDGSVPKIMQNGMFDATWLRKEGYPLAGWRWDTRAMHHALDPRDDHDLAYMASVYTRQPFWKHEAKDPDEIDKYATNSEALWSYNCIDAAVTLELYYALRAKLEEEGLLEFYETHYADLMAPLLDMALHGIRMDMIRMASKRGELDLAAKDISAQLETATGMPLVVNRGLSNDRLKYLFYGRKGFPPGLAGQAKFDKLGAQFPSVTSFGFRPMTKRNGKGESAVTVDEVTLRKLILKYNEQLQNIGPLLLELRRNRKMAEFVDTKILDKDGRMRCLYSFVTEAGRLASAATPWGVGRNLQNIDRELRFVFLPDLEEKK